MGKLISLKEAADLLGVSKQTLRNWDNNGKLKAERTEGGQRRYSEEIILRSSKVIKNGELFKKFSGEKWYLRDFDFLPQPISDRTPWIYEAGVIDAFKKNYFKWFDTYDECAKASVYIRNYLGIGRVDDENWLLSRKQALRSFGYIVD